MPDEDVVKYTTLANQIAAELLALVSTLLLLCVFCHCDLKRP